MQTQVANTALPPIVLAEAEADILADLAIAAGLLFRPALKWALGGGAALAGAYALGATIVRPDLWLDPLGSMVKVLPVIALSLLCLAMAEER